MRIRKIASFSRLWLDHGAQPPRTPEPRLKPLRAQPSPPLPRPAGAFMMSRNFGDHLPCSSRCIQKRRRGCSCGCLASATSERRLFLSRARASRAYVPTRLRISLFSLHIVCACARGCVGAYRQVRGVHVVKCVRAYDSFNVKRRWHGLMRPLFFCVATFTTLRALHKCQSKNASPAQRGPRRALQRLRVAGVAVLL